MKTHDPFPYIYIDGFRLNTECQCCGELAPVTRADDLGEVVCRPCAIQLRHASRVLNAAGFAGIGPDPMEAA